MTGKELSELRSQLVLTQEELGERLGVQKNTVWRWEHEHRRIPETVAKLVHYLEKEVKAEQKKTRKKA